MGCIKRECPTHTYSGEKWKTNATNKKYLAVDFKGRCAYCDDRDFYYGGQRNFHVEHFAPKEKFPALLFVYENLLYSCPYCNSSKSDLWPSNDPAISVVGTIGFVNPCSEEYLQHLERDATGKIIATTDLGRYMYKSLKLFLYRHELFFKIEQVEERKKSLEESIKKDICDGIDVSKKQIALNSLVEIFFNYYTEWQSLSPES